MEIIIGKTAGFCFGVKRAVDLVYKEADNKCCEKIYTYGPIIHNEEVMKDMKSKGIEIIHSEEELKNIQDFNFLASVCFGCYKKEIR